MHQPHPAAGLCPPRGDSSFRFEGTMVAAAVLPAHLPEEEPHQTPAEPAAWNSKGRQKTVQVLRLSDPKGDVGSQ